MPPSITHTKPSQEVRSYDGIGLKPAKASLRGPNGSERRTESDFLHGLGVWDAIVKGHGSVNAAAITMENTDPSLLKRQVVDGDLRLKKLFTADERALCAFAEYVLETFQAARKTPKQIAIEKLAEMQRQMADLQLVLSLEGE